MAAEVPASPCQPLRRVRRVQSMQRWDAGFLDGSARGPPCISRVVREAGCRLICAARSMPSHISHLTHGALDCNVAWKAARIQREARDPERLQRSSSMREVPYGESLRYGVCLFVLALLTSPSPPPNVSTEHQTLRQAPDALCPCSACSCSCSCSGPPPERFVLCPSCFARLGLFFRFAAVAVLPGPATRVASRRERQHSSAVVC